VRLQSLVYYKLCQHWIVVLYEHGPGGPTQQGQDTDSQLIKHARPHIRTAPYSTTAGCMARRAYTNRICFVIEALELNAQLRTTTSQVWMGLTRSQDGSACRGVSGRTWSAALVRLLADIMTNKITSVGKQVIKMEFSVSQPTAATAD
jgi:hypothetical protein